MNKSNTNALSGDAELSIGNLLKDGDTVNYDTYQTLLTKLGNDTTSIRNSAAINEGTPIVFQMGAVGSTPIYWQVVYQTADYITVWMTNSYTVEYFNNSDSSINNSALLGYTTGPYSNYANYSQSVIRDLTNKIYTTLSAFPAFPVLANIVVAPSIVAKVDNWQGVQKNAYSTSTSYWSITNGLETNKYTGGGTSSKSDCNPYNWSWTSCMSDMFWLPSHYEVFNIDTASSHNYTNGYWGLTSSSYIKNSSTTALDGSITGNCWLRSGSKSHNNAAIMVSDAYANGGYVNYTNGVRPACHISLSALEANLPIKIATTNGNSEIASQIKSITSNEYSYSVTFNSGYYLSQIQFTGDSTPRTIKSVNTYFADIPTCTAVECIVNSRGTELFLRVLNWHINEKLVITLYFTNTAQNYKAASGGGVEGVAIQTRLNGGDGSLVCYGEARICGYSTLDDLDYVHISAVAYSGYAFSHWEVDGESLDSATYGISANVPVSLVQDKVIVAVFTVNSAKINTDTDTGEGEIL